MTRQEARARSRRRFERRRRQRLALSLVSLSLAGLITAFGTNAVELLGGEPRPAARTDAGAPLVDRAAAEPQLFPTVPSARMLAAARAMPERPDVLPTPSTPGTRIEREYVPPGARISQRVRWEMERLKRLAKRQQTEGFVQLVSAEPGRIIAVPRSVGPLGTHVDYDPSESRRSWTEQLLEFQLHLGDAATPFAGMEPISGAGGASVPEPSTALLIGFGLVLLARAGTGGDAAGSEGARRRTLQVR